MAKKKQAATLVLQARQRLAVGRRDEATGLLTRSLALDPKNADAWSLLGGLHGLAGNAQESERCCQRALEIDPGRGEAWFNLAQAQLLRKRLDAAIDALQRLVRLQPRNRDGIILLGDTLIRAGRRAQGLARYLEAAAVDPSHGPVYYRLGEFGPGDPGFDQAWKLVDRASSRADAPAEVLIGRAKLSLHRNASMDALDAARRAVDLAPDNAGAHAMLGIAYEAELHFALAVGAFRRAVELNPRDLRYRCGLARALAFSGATEEAGAIAAELEAQAPTHEEVVRSLSKILARTGRHDEAAAMLRRLPGKSPTHLFELAHIKRFDGDAEEIRAIEEARAAAGHLPARERARLCFALGKVYGDSGDYDRSFAAYAQGNALVRGTIEHDPTELARRFERIVQVFDQDPALSAATGTDSRVPIFILGMPRSGTTLVESIIGAHPDVFPGGELPLIGLLSRYLDHQAGRPYPQSVGQVAPTLEREAAALLIEDLAELSQGAGRVTDKLPGNFERIGLIRRLFPRAAIVHVKRHPADTCLSIYFQLFAPERHRYSWDLSELGAYYREYLRLMDHWRSLLGDALIEIRYEDLILNREAETRRLIAACGLDWSDRCIEDFQRSQQAVQTASQWQVRQPIYRTSLLRYKSYEPHLGPLFDALGDCVETD